MPLALGGTCPPPYAGLVSAAAHANAGDEAAQDVAAQDVEIRVLRAELERKELEAAKLRRKAQDQEMEMLVAAATVGTLSAQVETSNDNRQALLVATAEQLGNHLSVLQSRLEVKRQELVMKDNEVMELRQAELLARDKTIRQQGERALLQKSKEIQDSDLAGLVFQKGKLERQCDLGRWKEEVEARVHLESTDAALIKERREWIAESKAMEEESKNLRIFISQMSGRCSHALEQLEKVRKREGDLRMEGKICAVASRLGQETAHEHMLDSTEAQMRLESRLRDESLHRASQQPSLLEQDQFLAGRQAQLQLAALSSCLREVSRALAEPATGDQAQADAVDAAMRTFLQHARELGETLPPVVRLGTNDYLVGNELIQCAMVGGVLCARAPGGMLMPVGDFMSSFFALARGTNGQSAFPMRAPAGTKRHTEATQQPGAALRFAAGASAAERISQ